MARKHLGDPPLDNNDAATVAYVQANKGTGGGGGGSTNLYIGTANPGFTSPGLWVQTDASGNIVTFWVETATTGTTYFDNFTDTNGVTFAAHKSALWGSPIAQATATVQNNTGVVQVSTTGGYAAGYVSATGVALSTYDISGSFAMSQDAVEQYLHLGVGSTNGSGSYTPNSAVFARIAFNSTAASSSYDIRGSDAAGTNTTYGNTFTTTLTGTTRYNFRFQYVPASGLLKFRTWVGATEPSTWDCQGTGATGYSGAPFIGVANGGASVSRSVALDDVTIKAVI